MTQERQYTQAHDMLFEFVQQLANADGGILRGHGIVNDARALLRTIAVQPDSSEQIARIQREHAAMKAALQDIIRFKDYLTTNRTTLGSIAFRHAVITAQETLQTIDSAATSATEPSVAVANGARLQNRNTEQFEDPAEYHNGILYASPVTYHGKEILNWHIYDKSAKDKNSYCVERNIRTRAHAVAQVDMLAGMIAANAAQPASGTDTVAGRYTLELAENEQTKALGFKPLGYFIVDNVDKTTHGFYSLDDKSDGQAEANRLNADAANAETGEA